MWCDADKSDLSQPNKTRRLAGSTDPADKSREEETEAECNHRVRPEHSTVHESGDHMYLLKMLMLMLMLMLKMMGMLVPPGDCDGSCEDPSHVADHNTTEQLGKRLVLITITFYY